MRNTTIPERGPYKAFLRGLEYKATRQDIGDFFADQGIHVKDVSIIMRDDQPSGSAIMEVDSAEDLEKTLALHNTTLFRRQLSIDVSTSREKNRGFGGNRDRGDRNGPSRDRDRDGAFSSFSRRDRDGPRDELPRERAPEAESAPKERPRLQLAPRTKTAEAAAEAAAPVDDSRPKASLFGGGRSREDVLREREAAQAAAKAAAAAAAPAPAAAPAAAPKKEDRPETAAAK